MGICLMAINMAGAFFAEKRPCQNGFLKYIISIHVGCGVVDFNISKRDPRGLNSTNKRNRVDQADHVCIVCKYTTNF